MKHIAFTIDEKFVRFCAVTMASILEHNEPSDVMFHVVSDGISQTACDILSQLAARKGAFIAFYTVPAEAMKGYSIRWEGKRLSMVVFYRCILASLLPESVSKVLYLDCDILVLDNIDELWNTDISGKALAAVPDSFIVNPVHCRRLHYDVSFNYFNGGVLLLNLDYWRENHIEAMRQRLISYREQLNTDKPLVIKLLHLVSRRIKRLQERSFDEAIGNENLLEELCCDEAAWEMVKKLIKSFDFESDSMVLACAHVGLSLAFMEAKRSLENIYLNPGQEIRERDLRFDSSRHLMQNHIVWDFMDEVSKETSRQFQSLINDFERKGHTVLMLTLREEVEHIGYIRLMDPEKYSFQETRRINAIYEGIDVRIRKSVMGV